MCIDTQQNVLEAKHYMEIIHVTLYVTFWGYSYSQAQTTISEIRC